MDLREKNNFEYRHPWELSRRDILLGELNKLHISGEVLDIGCGDRYFDKELIKKFSSISNIWGIDICAKNCYHNKKEHYINSYKDIEGKKYDYILMMDVLEHIDDDVDFLKKIRKYQKPNTIILITVPAFQFLFSLHDEELHHFRRYNRKSLKKTLEKAGYTIFRWQYFYVSLVLLRLLTKNKTQNLGMWNRDEKNFITRIIRQCLNLDFYILQLFSKIKIYIGGLSLMAICQNEQDIIKMSKRKCQHKDI